MYNGHAQAEIVFLQRIPGSHISKIYREMNMEIYKENILITSQRAVHQLPFSESQRFCLVGITCQHFSNRSSVTVRQGMVPDFTDAKLSANAGMVSQCFPTH